MGQVPQVEVFPQAFFPAEKHPAVQRHKASGADDAFLDLDRIDPDIQIPVAVGTDNLVVHRGE